MTSSLAVLAGEAAQTMACRQFRSSRTAAVVCSSIGASTSLGNPCWYKLLSDSRSPMTVLPNVIKA